MESLNQAFFLWINAPAQPNPLILSLAVFFAEWLIWAAPLLIGVCWLRGKEETRKTLLIAIASGILGLLINQMIGLVWLHPRPFMIGIGHTLIPHVADSSFPSDHLTLWWSIALSLWMQRVPHTTVLIWLGIAIAWARIYLGVHFPLDMLGSGLVAAGAAWLTRRGSRWYLEPGYRFVMGIYRRIFSRMIAQGWVHE